MSAILTRALIAMYSYNGLAIVDTKLDRERNNTKRAHRISSAELHSRIFPLGN